MADVDSLEIRLGPGDDRERSTCYCYISKPRNSPCAVPILHSILMCPYGQVGWGVEPVRTKGNIFLRFCADIFYAPYQKKVTLEKSPYFIDGSFVEELSTN